MADDASPSSSSDPPDSVASSDDPIERFLRKVDISTLSDMSSDGAALTRSRICALCECRLRGTFIFLPSAPGHLLWDVLVGLMIVYYLCMVPMRLAFEPHNPDSDLIAGKGIFLGIDILFEPLSPKAPLHDIPLVSHVPGPDEDFLVHTSAEPLLTERVQVRTLCLHAHTPRGTRVGEAPAEEVDSVRL